MGSLAGESALVTGAGRGIGKALAQRLAAAGAHVTVTARSCQQLEETAALSRYRLGLGCEAAGNPISISLNPIRNSCLNIRSLRVESMGSMSAWLPSRRSTLHQVGGAVRVRAGQVRSGRLMGANGRYLSAGLRNIGSSRTH